MDRWKTITIAAAGVLILDGSALARTSAPRTGGAAGATQNPESSQGGDPVKPPTAAQRMGKDPMAASGSTMKSERVRAIREALKSKGRDSGPVDGTFGPRTPAALMMSFQKAERLQASGRGDTQTLERLGVR